MRRDVDPRGRIVATLEDYRWTYVGFAPGLTSLYQPKVAETVLSVVRVIEQAIAEKRVKSQQQNGGNDASTRSIPSICLMTKLPPLFVSFSAGADRPPPQGYHRRPYRYY